MKDKTMVYQPFEYEWIEKVRKEGLTTDMVNEELAGFVDLITRYYEAVGEENLQIPEDLEGIRIVGTEHPGIGKQRMRAYVEAWKRMPVTVREMLLVRFKLLQKEPLLFKDFGERVEPRWGRDEKRDITPANVFRLWYMWMREYRASMYGQNPEEKRVTMPNKVKNTREALVRAHFHRVDVEGPWSIAYIERRYKALPIKRVDYGMQGVLLGDETERDEEDPLKALVSMMPMDTETFIRTVWTAFGAEDDVAVDLGFSSMDEMENWIDGTKHRVTGERANNGVGVEEAVEKLKEKFWIIYQRCVEEKILKPRAAHYDIVQQMGQSSFKLESDELPGEWDFAYPKLEMLINFHRDDYEQAVKARQGSGHMSTRITTPLAEPVNYEIYLDDNSQNLSHGWKHQRVRLMTGKMELPRGMSPYGLMRNMLLPMIEGAMKGMYLEYKMIENQEHYYAVRTRNHYSW